MARIYVVEPGPTGGPGAMGAMILAESLGRAGHNVEHLRLAKKAAGRQLSLAGTGDVVKSMPRPDAWFISCIYVRQWLWIPQLFTHVGLPMLAERRQDSDPLIVFGGQVSITPEPIASFADIIALGDGELTGLTIASLLDSGAIRCDAMRELRGRAGFYVPLYQSPPERFGRLEQSHFTPVILRPGDNDRGALTLEVARGCRSKCAFCPIGWAGGTYREAPAEDVNKTLLSLRGRPINLYAPDYSSVSYVDVLDATARAQGCANKGKDARLDAALRHLKADPHSAKEFSFGVEGYSERLRRAIGKPLAASKIIDTMERLAKAKINNVKWYVIAGLPGEQQRDWDEFIALLKEIKRVFPHRLEISPTYFQSVPHTPLQWEDNHWDAAVHARAEALRSLMREWWIKDQLQWMTLPCKGRETHEHDSALQRGDRRVAQYLIELAGSQAKLQDGRWRDIAAKTGWSVDLSAIPHSAVMPWSHVDVGANQHALLTAAATYHRVMESGSAPTVTS